VIAQTIRETLPEASSAPNICWSTAWSTWSSTAATCANASRLLLDYLCHEREAE
jgi:hypothetical protein